jgi:hypothetical protein
MRANIVIDEELVADGCKARVAATASRTLP